MTLKILLLSIFDDDALLFVKLWKRLNASEIFDLCCACEAQQILKKFYFPDDPNYYNLGNSCLMGLY